MQDLIPEKMYHPVRGMNYDSNGVTTLETECVDAVNVDISSENILPRKGILPMVSIANDQPSEDVLHFHRHTTPNKDVQLFAFCASLIYLQKGSEWVEVSNSLLSGLSLTQWSVNSTFDLEIGVTIVAAGSVYTRPNEQMDSGSDRVLIYWDETAELFETLVLRSYYPVPDEEVSVIAAGAGNITDTFDEQASILEIIPGLTYFTTIEDGTIGTIGSQVYGTGVNAYYKIIPTDDNKVEYGSDSYVYVDGHGYKITFLAAHDYDGKTMFVSYNYEKEVDHLPIATTSFRSALVYANTFEDGAYFPFRVRWTQAGSIFLTSENSYQDLFDVDTSPILKLQQAETAYYNSINSYIYVYRGSVIQRARYNTSFLDSSGLTQPFLLFEVAITDGIESPRTVMPIGGNMIYMGKNDIWIFDGINRKSISFFEESGNTRVQDYIFSLVDLENLDKNFALWDSREQKYMLFIQPTGDIEHTMCFVYNLRFNQWTRYIYPKITAAAEMDFSFETAIQDLSGAIHTLTGTIDDYGSSLRHTLVLSAENIPCITGTRGTVDYGYFALTDVEGEVIYDVDGEPLLSWCTEQPEYYFISRDFFGQDLAAMDRCQLVFVEGKGGDITLSYDAFYDRNIDNFLQENTLSFSSTYDRLQYNPDTVGFNLRLKVELHSDAEFRWLQAFTVNQELVGT